MVVAAPAWRVGREGKEETSITAAAIITYPYPGCSTVHAAAWVHSCKTIEWTAEYGQSTFSVPAVDGTQPVRAPTGPSPGSCTCSCSCTGTGSPSGAAPGTTAPSTTAGNGSKSKSCTSTYARSVCSWTSARTSSSFRTYFNAGTGSKFGSSIRSSASCSCSRPCSSTYLYSSTSTLESLSSTCTPSTPTNACTRTQPSSDTLCTFLHSQSYSKQPSSRLRSNRAYYVYLSLCL